MTYPDHKGNLAALMQVKAGPLEPDRLSNCKRAVMQEGWQVQLAV